jgi:PilZ domain
MTDDLDTISLRPTVVDGERQENDYEVIWRGMPIGRILHPPGEQHWWWGCNVYGKPPTPGDRGPGMNFKDCQVRFKIAWAKIRDALTAEEIAAASRHAEALAREQPPDQQAKPDEATIVDHNRAAQRQRVLKTAVIEFNGGTIDCVVRNVSETGAALEVESPVGIPSDFNLLIAGDRIKKHHCQVVWRKEKRIGVAFG